MMSSFKTYASALVCLLLAGCGGAGSTDVASTPTPAPTPTNSSLANLKYSQSFTNDPAANKVTFDLTTKTGIAGTARRNAFTISYDAATKGYTLTSDGLSQTFTPADVSGDVDYKTEYKKSGNGTSDFLTLQKLPFSGLPKRQYVNMGFWQRNAVSGTQQDTDFATFTYGLPTTTGMVRSGTAGFNTDTFGLVSKPGEEPRSFGGSGTFSVDFAAGVFATHTYLTETTLVTGGGATGGGIDFTGAGHLSSSDATFSGNALYQGWFGSAGGTLNGRFYGPAAEELGASFYGNGANGISVAGSFTGQRDSTVKPDNLTLTNLTQQQLFYVQYGYNSVGQLNWQNAETFTLSPPTSNYNGGQFTINDKVAGGDANFTTYRKTFSGTLDTQDVTLQLYKPGSGNTELPLTYASFGKWSTVTHSGVNSYPANLYFAYGLETPARLLSGKTGSGHYQGVVYGTGTAAIGTTYAVKGTSRFDVDFGAQSLSGGLAMKGTSADGSTSIDFGSFDFATKLPAYVAGTSIPLTEGSLNIGQLDIRFYGPDGEEIAGPFSLNIPANSSRAGAGTWITGVTAAKRQ